MIPAMPGYGVVLHPDGGMEILGALGALEPTLSHRYSPVSAKAAQ